jgi:hypothetical protein
MDGCLGHETLKMGISVNDFYNAKICTTLRISFFNKQKFRVYNGENTILCLCDSWDTRCKNMNATQAVVLQLLSHGMS